MRKTDWGYTAGEIVFAVFVVLIIGAVLALAFSGQSFKRQIKEWQTNFNPESVYREIEIIDMNGNTTYKDSGYFDIEYDEQRIKYINDNKLKIIYYSQLESIRVIEKEK